MKPLIALNVEPQNRNMRDHGSAQDPDSEQGPPWGSVNTSLQASQFLHDLSRHRIDLFGGVTVRLFRGLNLNFFGGASRVKDQLFISGAGLTPEERLLQTRQFETDFVYFGTVGFSYRFGSKFANVVNPRISGGGGF